MTNNSDIKTVDGFGAEWDRFNQSNLDQAEYQQIFESYFAVFPWDILPAGARGFDLGCGSGRWAKKVAPKVGELLCCDASKVALEVAKRNLNEFDNCQFIEASVDDLPIEDNSMDFGYSLGVLHHIPNTQAGMNDCVSKLKPGAPFLVYLYYSFDNRKAWFRAAWKVSDRVRGFVSKMPNGAKHASAEVIAATVYFPLARSAKLFDMAGFEVSSFPLSIYRDKSFYTMRTDALDRFGTRLEQRFSRAEIAEMMENAGLTEIQFSDRMPFWCAVGIKK